MTQRVLGPTGSPRRRWSLLLPLVAAIAFGLMFIASAQAVHDEDFQLDGDTVSSPDGSVGTRTQHFDWNDFFNASGAQIGTLPDASRPGFTAAGFKQDFLLKSGGAFDSQDNTTYTQGSKDIDNVSAWVCTGANNVTDKGDIMNAYSVAYTDPVSGHQKLYFALERSSNNGDANVGFWFLQDKNVDCDATNGTTNFSGSHQDGDIFVVSAFTKGGDVSSITAFRWNGGANGSLGGAPAGAGTDCRASTTQLGDSLCAAANEVTITTPWLTNNNGKNTGLGHSLDHGEFFEGGIDLTQTGLAGKCFNTFVGDTRSSQSTTATLYDFARGSLGECTSTTVTTPTPSGSTEIPANAQVTTSDSAKITVTGVPLFSGTVNFFLCGPGVASGANCQSGGVKIGATKTFTDATSPKIVASDSANLTKVGKYCWRAEYSGDSARGVPPSSDPSAGPPPDTTSQGECFTITPKTPTLVTCSGTYSLAGACTPGGSVDLGTAVTDRAHLTGTANEPGTGGLGDGSINPTGGNGPAQGTITFKLYGPDAVGSTTNCNTLAAGFPAAGLTASVNGDGFYGPVSFTPTAPGVYHWKASYSGDSPNTNGTSENNSACNVTDEDVTVRQIPTTISTAQKAYPNDSATITSTVSGDNLPSTGTVIFYLYGPQNGNQAQANCLAHGTTVGSGGLIYTQTFTNQGGAHSITVDTTNTTVAVNANQTVYWRVTYATGDSAHTGRQSDCAENTALAFVNDSGPGILFP